MIIIWIISIILCALIVTAIVSKRDSVYANDASQKNPLENKKTKFIKETSEKENGDGERGHLEAVGEVSYKRGIYDGVVKRIIDIILSSIGLFLLAPVYFGVAVAIKIDDPGPVFFTQKRIGKNKQYFKLHKFRTMKMSTPHDVPTHMIVNPEQYITKVGKLLRRYSIDELPQFWDIFIGNMSIIGPRPALWNQDLLIAERDKYNANDIRPGLTGWAQINGRDELAISTKAKLDGVYVEKLNKGGMHAFLFDCRCFFGTIFNVLRGDGVVEGGIRAMRVNVVESNEEEEVSFEDEGR